NTVGRISYNPFKMSVHQAPKPLQVLILRGMAYFHDLRDQTSHFRLTGGLVRLREHLFDEVNCEQKLVLLDELVVLLLTARTTRDLCPLEERTALGQGFALRGLPVFALQRLPRRHQDIAGPLEGLSSFVLTHRLKTPLFVFAHFSDHFVIEILDDVEMVEDRLDVGALFLKGFLEV